ncbi:MAG: TraR/DksA family transcriptional regulator [Gammaproteobacteria bacterium]|nr:TraR/DksA family transcriptional regulator [Gammaproteobacteria bacterium]
MPNPDLDARQLESLRSALEKRRGELELLLRSGTDASAPVTLDQQSVGRVSRIDAIQQQQMARASQQQARQTLRRVELALGRMADGDYGYCQHCGETIAYARLEAQPFASLCVDCQQNSETR